MRTTTDPAANIEPPLTSAFRLGEWQVDPASGQLTGDSVAVTLEPQLMTLLALLAANPVQVLSRQAIEAVLWPRAVIGDDTLARAVSRLRRALGDSAQAPRYIETLPKRGYRLIGSVANFAAATSSREQSARRVVPWLLATTVGLALAVWVVLDSRETAAPPTVTSVALVERANDLYMRFTRADNEAAIGLYERVLAEHPDNADAQAGLANALVQRVIRWPESTGAPNKGVDTLSEALARGLTQGPEATAVLERATAMAERAVRLEPNNPDALKSLAFTVTAQGNLTRGETVYKEVLALNSDAWAALINLGEIESMRGENQAAVDYYERAYDAMSRAYAYEPQRVGPWQVAMGVAIGKKHTQLGDSTAAELWYRRVLADAPYEPEATVRLAQLLAAAGNAPEARSLCETLRRRVGDYPGCKNW
ncbi:MAG: tetratricopeptide repeat protein [Pseudomonadota bacterium]